jgi:transcriptional regulator with GAF, ATPase, and Fis domain
MSKVTSKQVAAPDQLRQPVLDARLARNWRLMVGVTIASTVGMAVAVAPVLGEQFGTLWPWPNTHLVLLGGLAISVILLVAHLTIQQRRMSDIHGEVRCLEGAVQHLEEESIERERQNHARLKALLNISRMMGAVNRLDEVFDSVIDTCIELFDAHQASLMLLDSDTNELVVRAAKGHPDNAKVKAARQKVGEGIAGWVAKNCHPLILGPDIELNRYPGLQVDVSKLSAAVVVPVLLRDELIGVLSIRSRKAGGHYGEDDLQSLRVLAENIGTVIRHSEHVEWMRKTIETRRASAEHQPVS